MNAAEGYMSLFVIGLMLMWCGSLLHCFHRWRVLGLAAVVVGILHLVPPAVASYVAIYNAIAAEHHGECEDRVDGACLDLGYAE